ncbi:hypothetical protein F2Q69_00060045, partial [Brassica cretica]
REVLTKKQRKISDREKKQKVEKSGGRKVMDEIRSFEKTNLFDLGHPLINRIADSFVKASGIRAGFDASSMGPPSENAGSKKHRFPNLRGESSKSLEALASIFTK